MPDAGAPGVRTSRLLGVAGAQPVHGDHLHRGTVVAEEGVCGVELGSRRR